MKNTYILVDKYVIVFFKNKEKTEFFIIDAEDFDLINSFKNTWKPNVKKGKVESIVIRTQKNKIRKTYKIHNIIMKPPKGFVIDHINGLPIDNRKCNLRICTQAENAQNIHISKSKTGKRNITIENGKFRVRVKHKSYGTYNSIEDAEKIAEMQRKKLFNMPETLVGTDFLEWLMGIIGSTP